MIDQGPETLGFSITELTSQATANGLDAARILAALQSEIKRLGAAAASKKEGIQIVLRAALNLSNDPKTYPEAIFTLDTAFPQLRNRPNFVATRLKCMIRSAKQADMSVEAMRLLSDPKSQIETLEKVLDTIEQFGLLPLLPVTAEHAPNLIREIDRFLADPQQHHADWVAKVSATSKVRNGHLHPIGAIEWKQDASLATARLLWGMAANHLMQICKGALLYEPDPQRDRLWLDKMLTAEQRRTKAAALVQALGTDAVLATLNAGQSVVIAAFHAGLGIEMTDFFRSQAYPVSGVGRDSRLAEDPKALGVTTAVPGTGTAILKLAKAARQAPRIILIFPDGSDGERIALTCLGKTIQIGRGAAALAFFGKTKVFFARNSWTGQHFQSRLVPGPSPADYSDLQAFETAFADAAIVHIAEIMQGPPEDIGIFWQQLL